MGEWCNNCYNEVPDDKDALAVTVPRVHRRKPEKWIVCSRKCARIIVKQEKQTLRENMAWLIDQVKIVKVGRV